MRLQIYQNSLKYFVMQQLVLYQSCFFRTKILYVPQNLNIQIIFKVLTAKLQTSLEIYFYVDLCNAYAVKSLILDKRLGEVE